MSINATIYGNVWDSMVRMDVITTIKTKTAAGRKTEIFYLEEMEDG